MTHNIRDGIEKREEGGGKKTTNDDSIPNARKTQQYESPFGIVQYFCQQETNVSQRKNALTVGLAVLIDTEIVRRCILFNQADRDLVGVAGIVKDRMDRLGTTLSVYRQPTHVHVEREGKEQEL